MADGNGCICMAYSESECACDADWTPQIVYDQQAEIERLRTEHALDKYRLDWLEEKAAVGMVQIARSLVGTGFEVAIRRKAGALTVDVYSGSLRDAIDGAMGDYA